MNVQVPFGKMAFMPGRLIHTNEILVHLGDSYYAERSAAQALHVLARRQVRAPRSSALLSIFRGSIPNWPKVYHSTVASEVRSQATAMQKVSCES